MREEDIARSMQVEDEVKMYQIREIKDKDL